MIKSEMLKLIILAYAVSIANSISPLPIQFECEEQMISHFNLCLTNRFFKNFPKQKNATKPKGLFRTQVSRLITSNILSMCVNIII